MAEKFTMPEPVDVGDGEVAPEKQEQEEELSHCVVVDSPPQHNTNRPDLSAAVPYKTRVLKEILACISALSFSTAFGVIAGASIGNKEIDGNLYLSLVFFVISMVVALFMDATNRQTTGLVISVTISTLGWGFLAFVLIMNHGSSSAFTLRDLEMFFRALIVVIPQWIFGAFMNLNRP